MRKIEFNYNAEKPVGVFIQSDRIDECIAAMVEKSVDKVIINKEHKYLLQNLNFLKSYTFIKDIEIETEIDDCSALNFSRGLEHLSIHYSKSVIDFSNFKNLKSLNFSWNNNFVNYNQCEKLQDLTVWGYPKEDLSELKSLSLLEKLKIYDAKIVNLKGIEYLQNLKELQLIRAKNLQSIELLEKLYSLTELCLENSKKISNYNSIANLYNLKYLYILNCGATPNIDSLINLNQLCYGNINIDVIDGQVKPLLERPIIFKNYTHFSDKNTLKMKVTTDGNLLVRNGKILFNLSTVI